MDTEKSNTPEKGQPPENRRARDDSVVDYGRRKPLTDRRSGIERRQSDAPPPGEERRSGSDRRQVLYERRAPIDRRDMAFFEEFDDDTPLGGE